MDRNFNIGNPTATLPVALRKESVDRNTGGLRVAIYSISRSP